MQSIDVYDFDGTIYRGDSTADYIMFLLRTNFLLFFAMVLIIPDVIRYLVTKDLTVFKSHLFGLLAKFVNLEEQGRAFWNTEKARKKINEWFLNRKRDIPSIIASASPDFELKWIAEILDVDLICTVCDAKTGQLIGTNCKSQEKIRRIKEKYGDVSVRAMYTDNIRADRPLLELAREQYLVDPKNGQITKINLNDIKE